MIGSMDLFPNAIPVSIDIMAGSAKDPVLARRWDANTGHNPLCPRSYVGT
jgi:hypothetical protein